VTRFRRKVPVRNDLFKQFRETRNTPEGCGAAILEAVDDDAKLSAPQVVNYTDTRKFIRDWEDYWERTKPSTSAALDRAARIATDASAAIDMQIGRIQTGLRSNNADTVWNVFIDIEFLIAALWKMRLAGKLARSALEESWTAVGEFETAVPHLKLMRDVLQHIDDYGQDAESRKHHHPRTGRRIGRRLLHSQLGFNDKSFDWLGGTLNFEDARTAALQLESAIRQAQEIPPAS
jgi:hypothetical protein